MQAGYDYMTNECDAICLVISWIECLHKNNNIDMVDTWYVCAFKKPFLPTWCLFCSRGDLFSIVWHCFYRVNIVVGAWWMIATVVRTRRVSPSFPSRTKMQDCEQCSRSSSTANRHSPIYLISMTAGRFNCRLSWRWKMMQQARLPTNLNDENDITWIRFMFPLRMLYPSQSHLHSRPAVPLLLKPICLALLVD